MQVVSGQVIAFLGALGLSGKSAEREMPEALLRSPQAVVAAFLRGLFEGDGGVERSGRSLLRVSLSAKNRKCLRQGQTGLLRFGIVCAINEERGRGAFRLLIVGKDNLERFAQKIGFLSEAKRQALRCVLAAHTGKGFSQTDFVPYVAGFVRRHAARGQREWLGQHKFDRAAPPGSTLPPLGAGA